MKHTALKVPSLDELNEALKDMVNVTTTFDMESQEHIGISRLRLVGASHVLVIEGTPRILIRRNENGK